MLTIVSALDGAHMYNDQPYEADHASTGHRVLVKHGMSKGITALGNLQPTEGEDNHKSDHLAA